MKKLIPASALLSSILFLLCVYSVLPVATADDLAPLGDDLSDLAPLDGGGDELDFSSLDWDDLAPLDGEPKPKPPAKEDDLAPLDSDIPPATKAKKAPTYFRDKWLSEFSKFPPLPSVEELVRWCPLRSHSEQSQENAEVIRAYSDKTSALAVEHNAVWQQSEDGPLDMVAALKMATPKFRYEVARAEFIVTKNRLADAEYHKRICDQIRPIHESVKKQIEAHEGVIQSGTGHSGAGLGRCQSCDKLWHQGETKCYMLWRGCIETLQRNIKANLPDVIRWDKMAPDTWLHTGDNVFGNPYQELRKEAIQYWLNACHVITYPTSGYNPGSDRNMNVEQLQEQLQRCEEMMNEALKEMSPKEKARAEKEKKWYEENERKKTREIKKQLEDDARWEKWLEDALRRRKIEKRIDDLAPLGEDLDDLAPLSMDKQAVPSSGVPTAQVAQPQPAVAQNAQAKITKAQRVANSTPQGIVAGTPELPSVQDLCNPKALEKFKNEVMMRDIYVERKLNKLNFSFDELERIEKMSDADLDKAIEKLVAFNKSNLEMDIANMKDELSASTKIDAIRAKYPNESDTLKRATECFTVWREHTLGVQKRLMGQLKSASELGTEEGYEVAQEYLSVTASVCFLPPEGYAESLQKSIVELEKVKQ